jgi:hypothetical protein
MAFRENNLSTEYSFFIQAFGGKKLSVKLNFGEITLFYSPQMEYEGSIGIVSRKMKKIYCRFSRFRTFIAKKLDLSENFFSVCHAPLPPLLEKFVSRPQPSP